MNGLTSILIVFSYVNRYSDQIKIDISAHITISTIKKTLQKVTRMDEIIINDDFRRALQICTNTSENVFITGQAGTGKSTFLQYLKENTKKPIVVLAPTGVAALNVSGQTIHSFFRFPNNITVEDAFIRAQKEKEITLFKRIKAIIIDEVSMVRADIIDCIDIYLQTILKKKILFGGIQMILIGDLFQLPPVVTSKEKKYFEDVYKGPYFFNSFALNNKKMNLRYVELSTIYRQSENKFIDLLIGDRGFFKKNCLILGRYGASPSFLLV